MTTMWEPLKLLLPAYGAFWIFSLALAAGFWFGWTKLQTKMTFDWKAPFFFATFISLVFCGYNFMTIYNGNTLFMAQNANQQNQNQQQANQPPLDPALKMKAEFLGQVEKAIQNPAAITKEFKTKIFKDYAKLFPTKDAREQYKKAITDVYNCQRTFWEDAMAAYKTKQMVKSESRKQCEKLSGEFFNRARMIPEDTSKANDKLMEDIAANHRLPASDGKTVELTEKMIRDAMDAQSQGLQAINQLFN